MFNKLSDFGYDRSGKEAVGFYLTYLLLLVLVGSLVGGFVALVFPEDMFGGGLNLRVGTGLAILTSVGLSYMVLQKKKMVNNVGLHMLAVFGGLLSVIGGGILGMIVPAYLTMRKPASKTKSTKPTKRKKK